MHLLLVSSVLAAGKKCHKKYAPKAVSEKDTMASVPVTRASYEPVTQVQAAYVKHDQSANSVVGTHFNFTTTKPTVNLANFPQVQKISCNAQEEEVNLSFQSQEAAQKAFDAWRGVKDLVLMIPHEEESCNGKLAAAVTIKTLTLDKTTIVADTNPAKHEDFMQEYEVTIKQYDAPQKRWEKTATSKPWFYGLNFDQASQSPVQPYIPLAHSKFGDVGCDSCYAFGVAKLSLNIKGTFVVVKSYSIDLDGEVKANMGLKMTLNEAAKLDIVRRKLFSASYAVVAVPGLFSLTPEFTLTGAVTYKNTHQIDADPGFTFDYPFSFGLYSDNGIFKAPKFRKNANPSLEVRPLKMPKQVEFAVEGHLIPQFDLSFTILAFGFDLGVAMDNALGLEVDVGCKSGFELELYGETSIAIFAEAPGFHKQWTVFDSGKKDIKCFFCQTCAATSSTLPAATSTTTASATSTLVSTTSISVTSTSASATVTSVSVTSTSVSATVTSVSVISTSASASSAATSSVATTSAATSTGATTSAATSSATTSSVATTSAATSTGATTSATTSSATTSSATTSVATSTKATTNLYPVPTSKPTGYALPGSQ
ncbi:hypothetical protein EDD86DRAFT_11028 [Gorgonomyces haynaldii]|nr:hypothetical protein EDD86DRAFT_11028 [Gorgonomyces haynaldii]